MSCFLMINISFQSITHKRMMKRTSTKIERKAERICHTARMRKTTTAKTANVGRIPPKLVTIPPTKAHTKRTATYATKPTSNHFTKIFMPIGMEPKPRFKSCCISVLFFITLTFFLCLVGGFTLLVSGGRYGRGENVQGFWRKIFNRPAGRIEKFSPKPVGRGAALHIFRGPGRSFAP